MQVSVNLNSFDRLCKTIMPAILTIVVATSVSFQGVRVHAQTLGTLSSELDRSGHVAAKDRSRVLLVRPVILCDDDGSSPANHARLSILNDQVLSDADLEVLYLEPNRWNHGKALRGEISVDEIVLQGKQRRIICRDDRVLSLVFVSAVKSNTGNAKTGPMRCISRDGNVCVVSLGDPSDNLSESDLQVSIADEFVGNHVSGYKIEELRGERPTSLTDDAMRDKLREAILASPFAIERVHFYSRDEGRREIVDESWEPYLSELTDDYLRFTIGLKADDSVPNHVDAKKEFAEQAFPTKVLEFDETEKETLSVALARLEELTGNDWPLVSRIPWHFLKVESSFCNGYPHTRGLTILLTAKRLRTMAQNKDVATFTLVLLLHEKLHVLQRLNPHRFDELYKSYGFHKTKIADGEAERLNVAMNPDALDLGWSLQFGEQHSAVVTVFRETNDRRLSFKNEYRVLEKLDDETYRFGDEIPQEEAFEKWALELGLRAGLEHPNEAAAYLSGPLLTLDYLTPPDQRPATGARPPVDLTRDAFRNIMRSDLNAIWD